MSPELHILPSHKDYKALDWLQTLIAIAKNPHIHFLTWVNGPVTFRDQLNQFETQGAADDLVTKLEDAQGKVMDDITNDERWRTMFP